MTRVRLFSCTFEVLKSLARLVDAPGLGGANKARNNILSYLNKAQVIWTWTCGDMNRILSEENFYEMVNQAGKLQLLQSTSLTCIRVCETLQDTILRDSAATTESCRSGRDLRTHEFVGAGGTSPPAKL